MARKYEVAIASETGAFEKGIKSGVIEPLEDAEKALKDLGDTDVGKDVERDLDIAQRSTKNLKDETKDVATAIERHFNDAYRKVKDDSQDATKKVKSGFDDVADEAKSSGKEAAASFSGGFDDVADFVQEVLANAFEGMGPVGLVAGTALAALLGTVLANAEAAQEKLNAARERASELSSQLYENNGTIPMTERLEEMFDLLAEEAGPNNGILNLIDNWTDFGSTLDAVKRSARLLGREADDMVKALSGEDLEHSEEVLDSLNEKIKELESSVGTAWAWDPNLIALREARDEIDKTIKANELAAEVYEATGGAQAKAAEEMAERVKSATESVREEVSSAYDDMRDAAYEKTVADTQAFDIERWLTYVEETRAQADAYKTNLQAMKLTPSEWENLLAMPEDARTAIVNSYATAGEDGKTRIREALGDGGGGEAGGEAAVAFDDAFNPDAEVKAEVDTSAAEAKVKDLTKDRTLKVKVKLDTSEYDRWDPPAKRGRVTTYVDKSAWNDWTPATKIARVRTVREA